MNAVIVYLVFFVLFVLRKQVFEFFLVYDEPIQEQYPIKWPKHSTPMSEAFFEVKEQIEAATTEKQCIAAWVEIMVFNCNYPDSDIFKKELEMCLQEKRTSLMLGSY